MKGGGREGEEGGREGGREDGGRMDRRKRGTENTNSRSLHMPVT